ncbi:Pentatricopeptide repeat-containing protein [Dichanthelium oligosanthes]|uniref:Pentatricopeptide repeat-containing protein n=1 Tax=Dichanthelium oligosanthes TaxID=888268 RepID=A0A1E5V239_9POAL|nr:Pentatricopeptide repeat-containing protein [Dichanthelium oligosanthes]
MCCWRRRRGVYVPPRAGVGAGGPIGNFLKTHDFLQPWEKPGAVPSPAFGADDSSHHQQPVALPLPGGIGTFTISPAPVSVARPAAAVVKAEPPFVLWGQPAALQPVARGAGHQQQWALPFAGAGQAGPSPPDRKGRGGGGGGGRAMESGSRSSGGAGFDDDDGLAARREVSSSLQVFRVGLAELTVRKRTGSVEGMSSHAPTAPGTGGSQWQPAQVHQLHAHLLVSGRLLGSPTIAALALLRAACRVSASPCLRPLARHLLDEIPHPPPQLLHAAARLASRLRLPSLTLCHYLALRARHPGFLPPAPAIADVLKSVPGRAAHAHALRVATHAVDARFLDNTLIAMYFACGNAWSARQVFEGMRDRDVVSWTSLISGLVQNGCPLQGLRHFASMMHSEVCPDFVLLVSVLKAYMELDDLPGATAAHSLVVKSGFDNELDVVITLTSMYAKFGCIVAARALFDRVPTPRVNVILWNAMISGYSKNGLANEAVQLFKQMRKVARSMIPDSVTLRSVILACAQLGSVELAEWMEDYVQGSEYRDDVLVNTALIDMYSKAGSIARAHTVFERMQVQVRDVVVWSALIGGYGVHGHFKEAVALFEEMKNAGVKPNDVTFLGLLSACNHVGAVEKGWSYFHSMKHDYGIEPRHQHYACVVDLLARAGHLDRAYQFIKDMPIKPEMSVWGALLHGCKMHGHSDMALAECAAQHIFELEHSNAGHYVQLANLYASVGMWSQVAGVRVTMRERGVSKATGCSSIDINGELHSFHAGDHSHPRAAEIFALLSLLSPTPAGELTVRMDRKGGSCSDGGMDQRPNTPRSKHSATEQRRRSKINDRFQILRELLPHSDQKRDKATFLLEVIEYIRFLQEKVQKYEATFPEWNQENAKMLPWSKEQIPGDSLPVPSHFMRNGSSPGSNFTGKLDDNHNTVTYAAASGAQDQAETDHMASVCDRSVETPANITNNALSQSQPQWTGPSPVNDCAVNEMLNNQQLAIDEGTISISSQYSQELLNSLTHALQSSGVDLSEASISVQINLGKRAVKRPAADVPSKEPTDPASSDEIDHQLAMLGGGAEDLSHAAKRQKPGNT